MKMTQNNQRQGGRYNQSKEWSDEGKTGEPFKSADDGLAYVPKKRTVIMDKMEKKVEEEEPVVEQEEAEEQEPAPYKQVDYKKRYDDLKRHHDRKLKELKRQYEEEKAQMRVDAPTYVPPKTAEELAAFKNEQPEIFAVVESIAHIRGEEQTKELYDEVKQLKEQLQYAEAREAYAQLKLRVPDFEEIRKTDAFHQWAEEQPEQIQDWVYHNNTNVDLAVKAIQMYKADMGIKPVVQKKVVEKPPVVKPGADEAVPTKARVEEPTATQGRIWKASEIAALSAKQAEQMMDEIDKAFAEGRVNPYE